MHRPSLHVFSFYSYRGHFQWRDLSFRFLWSCYDTVLSFLFDQIENSSHSNIQTYFYLIWSNVRIYLFIKLFDIFDFRWSIIEGPKVLQASNLLQIFLTSLCLSDTEREDSCGNVAINKNLMHETSQSCNESHAIIYVQTKLRTIL